MLLLGFRLDNDYAPMRQLLVAESFVPCGTIYVADGSLRIAYQKSLKG